jgi:hypothetical protein
MLRLKSDQPDTEISVTTPDGTRIEIRGAIELEHNEGYSESNVAIAPQGEGRRARLKKRVSDIFEALKVILQWLGILFGLF